jgi:hypothetical protein
MHGPISHPRQVNDAERDNIRMKYGLAKPNGEESESATGQG